MGKKRKRQRPAAAPGETFRLVESNGENLLEGLVLRATPSSGESELLTFINDGLARGTVRCGSRPTCERRRAVAGQPARVAARGFFDFNAGGRGSVPVPPLPPILSRSSLI